MHLSRYSLIAVLSIGVCVAAVFAVALVPAVPIGDLRFEPFLFEPIAHRLNAAALVLLTALLVLAVLFAWTGRRATWLRTGPGSWSLHALRSIRGRHRSGGWALA
jgi:type VI protein secretion system component VasK